MKAIIIRRFGDPDVLELADIAIPEPGPRQLRIRVAASAVNPIDVATRSGALVEAGLIAPGQEVGLGWDVAGTVDAIGRGATRFGAGDRVIALRDLMFTLPGAYAEYVVLDEEAVARAPRSVSLVQAGALPLNALTASGALTAARLTAGQTLLVTGAAGGVGGFVLQLARRRGLRTLAVASAADERLVAELGATEFLARTDSLGTAARALVPGGVDAVIDAAVLGIAAHDALRSGGVFVALVRPFAPPPIRATTVIVHETFADGGRLAELSALVDSQHLTPRVAQEFPLAQAAAAHTRYSAGGLHGGRVMLTP